MKNKSKLNLPKLKKINLSKKKININYIIILTKDVKQLMMVLKVNRTKKI